jgi:hypothetical protein
LDEFGDYKLQMSLNDLPLLTRALPQLHSLSAQLDRVASDPSVHFPAQLRLLSVCLPEPPYLGQTTASALLSSIGQLPLLHTLRLELVGGPISLLPLQQLPLLRDLELQVPFQQHTEQFAVDLRALHRLHRLYVAGQSDTVEHRTALFCALLRDVPEEQLQALQWRDFFIAGFGHSDELSPLLLRLPSLERLEAHLMRCRRFAFLSALPRLTHLDLQLWWGMAEDHDAWTNFLSVFTSDGLARLHSLRLTNAPCISDELKQILLHTPALTNLTLDRLRGVNSLSFFRQLPTLATTLTHLTVECYHSWRLTAADLPPLIVLQKLRQLRLLQWSSEPHRLTAADLAPFQQRPCIVLPHLAAFEWTTAV